MDRIQFMLRGGLSERQTDLVHRAVLKILDETGFACDHPPTVEAVTGLQGARFENGRLKFSPELVSATIEQLRSAGRKHRPAERLRVTAPWNCLNIIDMDTDEVRPSVAADATSMLKLVASSNDSGPAPVYPCDLHERLQILWLEKSCLELTPGFGGGVITQDPETIRWIGRLYAAAGRRYTLTVQFLISPLRLDHLALDLLLRFREDPLVDVVADTSPIPIGGMTAPLFASGLLAQGIAESLGGMIVARCLDLVDADEVLWPRVDFGDMRDMTVGHSLPESVMIQVLLRDLREHFSGLPLDLIYLNTNAKRPNAFATVDRMAYMLMLGLAGFREFCLGAGQLSVDEIFSPVQFIIDMEIGRYVQRILDGLVCEGEPDDIAQVIADGVSEGSFLTHPTTLAALPDLFDSQLFRRDGVNHWRADGEPMLEQLALDRARQTIDSYHYELEADKQLALDRTFDEACRALGVDVASQPIPPRMRAGSNT